MAMKRSREENESGTAINGNPDTFVLESSDHIRISPIAGSHPDSSLPSSHLNQPSTKVPCAYCSHPPFSDYPSYELHTLTNHNYNCNSCHKKFPTALFLNLHIDENHNPFLKIKQEQGEKIFRCFQSDEGCTKVCSTPKKRRLHMVDKHGYPRSFKFEVVNRGI